MTPSNGTALVERPAYTVTLPAVALSSVLLLSTGHQAAIPELVNGTHIACVIGPIAALTDKPILASSISAMLTEIRSNFQLNSSELAQILGISRPTLYAWSSETAAPRATRVRRIKMLRDASASWRAMIGDHTDAVSQRFGDRPQLLEILSAADVDDTRTLENLGELAMARHGAQIVESTAERLRRLGFGEKSAAQQSRTLEDHGW